MDCRERSGCGYHSARERAAHPTRAQVEALVEFLERNPILAKGFLNITGKDAARRSWEELTVQLNSMGGSTKSVKQWLKYWSDKKNAVKKKVDGSVGVDLDLKDVEERIVALMAKVTKSERLENPLIYRAPQVEELQNTTAEENPTAECIPGTYYASSNHIYIPEILTRPDSTSPPRSPPIVIEIVESDQIRPSRVGVHPASPPARAHEAAQTPTQLRRKSNPRRRRRPSSLPPKLKLRSQLSSMANRILKLEEQRSNHSFKIFQTQAEIAAKKTDALAAIVLGLKSIKEGMHMFSQSLHK